MAQYKHIQFVRDFFDELDAINLTVQKLNELKFQTWAEIRRCEDQKDSYYFFLRLKIFLYDIHCEDENEALDWLEFFQEKFLETLH